MRPAAARVAALAAVAAACVGPVADAAPCARYTRDAWVTVAAPEFAAGPAEVADYAVAARDPDRLYVTNGTVVVVSTDGGCTWTDSLTQPDLPLLGATPEVRLLAVSASDPDVGYAALGSDTAARPGVLRTTDGGRSWQPADRGLEAVQGRPLRLVVSPSRPEVAYLVVEGNQVSQGDRAAEVARALFATEDGGATWTERTASPLLVRGPTQQVGPVGISGNGSFEGVAVDPRDSRRVWLYGGFGLYVSTDGARTSQRAVSGFEVEGGGPIGHVDLYRSAHVSRVLAFGSQHDKAWGSFDGGAKFFATATPGIVRSAVSGRRHSELAVATDTQVLYQRAADAAPRVITPAGPSVRDLAVAFGDTPVFYARTTAALLRWTAPLDARIAGDRAPVDVPDDPTRVVVPRLPALPTSTLSGPREVTLRAGERRTVPYTLDLPGVQRADVYFLVDVSDSMQQEIAGLRSALAGIVTDLVAANVDAHFGVGRFNTYDSEPYFRVTPVAPPGPRLAAALEQLSASAGGDHKSHLEAVRQSVTGEGRVGEAPPTTVNPGGAYFIPAHQAAGFRRESPVKLVLTVTDEGFYEGPPSPSYDTVGAALRAAGVKQLGLALDNGDVLPPLTPGPEVGLRRLAEASGALAPEGGVDCDGDGAPDVAAGEPLVCAMPSDRSAEATLLANAIVNLVRSLPNRGSVDFAVRPTAAGVPAAVINRTSFPVEFHRLARRSVEVTFSCPAVTERATYRYAVSASAQGAPLAVAETAVRCVPRTTGPPPAVRGALPTAALALPPAQPPSHVSNANPNVNPNPQSQPQAQPQLGAAAEPEEEQQLQAAGVDVLADDVEELAMSRRPDPVPAAFWLGGAVALSAAAAVRLRPRTRAAVVRAR